MSLLLPTPLHLLALLIALTAMAFRARDRRWRRWRFVLLAATAWTWLALTPAFVHLLARSLEHQYPPPPVAEDAGAAFVVVLASGEPHEAARQDRYQLDLAGFRRTLTGIEQWRRVGGKLIFTGTTRVGEGAPVSERMAALAMDMGVPRSSLAVETEALNTYENLRNVAVMLPPGETVRLVTSALHMPRAMAVARALDIEALPIPCDFRARQDLSRRAWLPDAGTLGLLEWVLHEWAGRVYYEVRGWA